MNHHVASRAILTAVISLLLIGAQRVQAEVDLLFDPPMQTIFINVNDMVEINLVAHSADGSTQAIDAIDMVLDWDPDVLELLGADDANAGYAWFIEGFLNDPDDINDGTSDPPIGVPANDGDAIYTVLAQIDNSATTGPDDLIIVTIQFRALQTSTGTEVSFTPFLGEFGETRVFGEGIQNNITGDISATALIAIVELCSENCPTDVDGNFRTEAFDLAVLLGCWGAVTPGVCECLDADNDGDIDATDLAFLLGAWGSCPGSSGACCNADGMGGCEILLEEDCETAGGDFLGTGTECDDCPHLACLGGTGDCCEANGTPGCEQPTCCEAVCDTDPSCCEDPWSSDCADLAEELCLMCFPPPANDDCADALPIFDGLTDFVTVAATTDGPAHPSCQFDGQTYNDIWYNHVATCNGTLTVTTCKDLGGSADYDTDLVVYDGCSCPAMDENMLGCNDDDKENACGDSPDFQSTVSVPVVADNCYKIRIGGFAAGNSGSGTVLITCNE